MHTISTWHNTRGRDQIRPMRECEDTCDRPDVIRSVEWPSKRLDKTSRRESIVVDQNEAVAMRGAHSGVVAARETLISRQPDEVSRGEYGANPGRGPVA